MREEEKYRNYLSSLCINISTSEHGVIRVKLAMPYSADIKLKGTLREKIRLETCS